MPSGPLADDIVMPDGVAWGQSIADVAAVIGARQQLAATADQAALAGAQLIAAKVWQDSGAGGSLAMIWAAQQYCVENGARILTMSLGIPGDIAPYFMRNERFNCDNIRNAGVVFFNSAGNDHYLYSPPIELSLTARVPPPWLPEGYPYSSTGGVITVGGTGYKNDFIYSASSRGPANWGNVEPWNDWPYLPGPGLIKPDVAVPGVSVNSTIIPSGYSGDTWNGTSMACPHVTGAVALLALVVLMVLNQRDRPAGEMATPGVEKRLMSLLFSAAYFSRKKSASSRISVLRSRRGGIWMGKTFKRKYRS